MEEGDALYTEVLMSNSTATVVVSNATHASNCSGPSAADVAWQEDFAFNVDGMLNFFTGENGAFLTPIHNWFNCTSTELATMNDS